MKYHVNGKCIGCGMCAATCPAIFRMTERGQAQAAEADVGPEDASAAKWAMGGCPVNAIEAVQTP